MTQQGAGQMGDGWKGSDELSGEDFGAVTLKVFPRIVFITALYTLSPDVTGEETKALCWSGEPPALSTTTNPCTQGTHTLQS